MSVQKDGGFMVRGLRLVLCVGVLTLMCDEVVVAHTNLLNLEPVSACRVGLRVYESDRGRQLLGEAIREDFTKHLPGWDKAYDLYEPSSLEIDQLAAVKETVEIICVLGSWCHDSEENVPRFWKILDQADNPNLKLIMFAVGRTVDSRARDILIEIGFDEDLRQQYNVDLVPTFIFYVDDQEIGRIIETPETTLEHDAAQIVSQKPDESGTPSWN